MKEFIVAFITFIPFAFIFSIGMEYIIKLNDVSLQRERQVQKQIKRDLKTWIQQNKTSKN